MPILSYAFCPVKCGNQSVPERYLQALKISTTGSRKTRYKKRTCEQVHSDRDQSSPIMNINTISSGRTYLQ